MKNSSLKLLFIPLLISLFGCQKQNISGEVSSNDVISSESLSHSTVSSSEDFTPVGSSSTEITSVEESSFDEADLIHAYSEGEPHVFFPDRFTVAVDVYDYVYGDYTFYMYQGCQDDFRQNKVPMSLLAIGGSGYYTYPEEDYFTQGYFIIGMTKMGSGMTYVIDIPDYFNNLPVLGFGANPLVTLDYPMDYQYLNNDYEIEEINLPAHLRFLGRSTFSYLFHLKTVHFKQSPVDIPADCFAQCTSLENVGPLDKVEAIEFGAFSHTKIQDFPYLPSLTAIGRAFLYCDELTEVDLSQSRLTKMDGTFLGCHNLIQITLPSGISDLGYYTFSQTGFTSFSVPDGVTEINDKCFEECEQLTEITLPSSLTHLGINAFGDCSLLETVNYGGSCDSFSDLLQEQDSVDTEYRIFFGTPDINVICSDGTLSLSEGMIVND